MRARTGGLMRDAVTRAIVGLYLVIIGVVAPSPARPATPDEEAFEAKVRPVLAERCLKCHGAQKQSGGLRLDSREAALAGGENGPAVAPGDPAGSPLIRAIRHEGDVKMPPKAKLPDPAIAALTAWVKAGAPWPRGAIAGDPTAKDAAETHWAFRPVRQPAAPAVKARGWVATPVDAFILAALEAKGLTPSPKADKRTLIRRATFDLTGLPPTEAEIAAFEADRAPGAYATVVDRLLASPRYGERWGRHWLDVARYADTKGYVFQEERRYPNAYTYRDYVIRAFNEDLPYDQFLIQQLAADRLPPVADTRPLAAMGFLTLGRRFLNAQEDIIDDRIDVVSRGLLGLTVACARCHDHKFDPIPTEDYYSLFGVFASSVEPADVPTIGESGPNPQLEGYKQESEARRKAVTDFVRGKLDGIQDDLRKNVAAYLLAAAELGPGVGGDRAKVDAVAATHKLPNRRLRWFAARWDKHLAETWAAPEPITAPWHALAALPADGFAAKAAALVKGWVESPGPAKPANKLIARSLAEAPPASMKDVAARYGEALARADAARREPPKARDAPADPERDALAQFLVAADGPFAIPDDEGRRLLERPDAMKRKELEQKVAELDTTHPGAPARAMVLRDRPDPHDTPILLRGNVNRPGKVVPRRFLKVATTGPDRPLFKDGSGRLELARAITAKDNPLTARVMVNRIWMHHFGAGLVATPSDFGLRSDPPTHPELLDDLAARFVAGGWSIKAVHRLIMLSNTYQQRSDDRPDCRAVDPANRLLWKRNKRRLEFEALRDSILAVAGHLDPAMGGRPVAIDEAPFSDRRTVYGFIDRQNLPGVFRTFDFATPDATSARRFTTMVPQQALFLMNSPFVAEQARRLAARPELAALSNPEDRIRRLYGWALGRSPEPQELALGVRFLGSPEPAPGGPWINGYGGVDEAAGKVVDFRPFPDWSGTAWQVGPKVPDAQGSFLNLAAGGGHVGVDARHAIIRRWVAPRDAAVAIDGTLDRPEKGGDGVRARVVGPAGVAGTWVAHGGKVATPVPRVEVKAGEAIDFVVDCRANHDFDSFTWAPTLRALDGQPGRASWDARADFAGPPPEPLTPLEAYAQVLLLTNEFMYVD